MKPSNKADLSKLSHLIVAGRLIHTLDGGVYRVTSKTANADGFNFKLADLQGKPVATPANFKPVSAALARFAAWMRFVVAYNEDFNMYVQEYIKAAGLPVDREMNWAKFLYAVVAPKLISRDPEVVAEAIHQIIIKALAERKILDASNPNGFKNAIKKFPPAVRELPEEKQVTRFLEKAFSWRISEANEYIKTVVYQEGADSMWGTEGDEDEGREVNLLDTEDHATGRGAYDLVEADADVSKFRKGFSDWLYKKFRKETADDYLYLFDKIYNEIKSMGSRPSIAGIFDEWNQDTGKSLSQLKVRFAELPKLIDTYIKKNLGEMRYDVHPFLELMRSVGKAQDEVKEKAKATHASLANLNVAAAEGVAPAPKLECCGSVSNNHKPGCKKYEENFNKTIDAIKNLPPRKNAAGQWETPKCEICGTFQGLHDCSTCGKRLCDDHLDNHKMNNPSHQTFAMVASGFCECESAYCEKAGAHGSGCPNKPTKKVSWNGFKTSLCDQCLATMEANSEPGEVQVLGDVAPEIVS